jgi:hypothetical protein
MSKSLYHNCPAKNAYMAFTKLFFRYHVEDPYVSSGLSKKIRMFPEDVSSNCLDWNKLKRRFKRKSNVETFLWSNNEDQ